MLGRGSQVRAHVVRRFPMAWSHPVARTREYVASVRAIWTASREQAALHFRDDFYEHSLMTPPFDHGASPYEWPAIHNAGVVRLMTRLAGEVADGFLAHAFTTLYRREVTILEELEAGLARAGGARHEIETSVPVSAILDGTVARELRERSAEVGDRLQLRLTAQLADHLLRRLSASEATRASVR